MIKNITIPVQVVKQLKNRQKGMLFSGGGTKFVGQAEAARVVEEEGYLPDFYGGVSSGAILALICAMNLTQQTFELLSKLIPKGLRKSFFKVSPVNDKGNFTLGAILRLIQGKPSLGDQTGLIDLLKLLITPQMFEDWKYNPNSKDAYIYTVGARTGSGKLVNLKEYDFETALKWVLASASIPVFANYVEIDGIDEAFYDGGLRQHLPATAVLNDENLKNKIDSLVTIYSRPEDYDISEKAGWRPLKALLALSRSLDIQTVEISKGDQLMTDIICSTRKIPVKQIFLPRVMDSVYDDNPERLARLRVLSIDAASAAMKTQFEIPTVTL